MAESLKIDRAAIGRRIKEALKGRDTTEIAARLGIGRPTIYDWTQGRSLPEVERLIQLAALTNRSVAWLTSGSSEMPEGYVLASAMRNIGERGKSPGQIQGVNYLALNEDWLRTLPGSPNAGGLLLTPASGDAMYPTIQANDLLLVNGHDGNKRLRDGIYAIVELGGGEPAFLVRRVQKRTEGFLIRCDNHEAYPDDEIVHSGTERQKPRLFMRVIWFGRSLP